MRLEKLIEALRELEEDRNRIEAAIRSLRAVLDSERLSQAHRSSQENPESSDVGVQGSYIDLAVKALEEAGRAQTMNQLVVRVGLLKGKDLDRKSLEATFHKHISRKGSGARIVRIRPGVYDLPRRAPQSLMAL